jgi:ATP-dependent helicase HrpB
VVVDSGLARAPRFDPRTGMTRLRTVPISRASADQRTGRAGRTEPGAAYRLWSKVEHAGRRAHGDPEITQVDLAGLALELAEWGADAASLPFLDRPPAKALGEARRLLADLGALGADGRPTEIGRSMTALPLHPRLARMVVDAAAAGLGPVGVWLAIALEERDVLRGPLDQLPVDLALRVAVLAGDRTHAAADRRALDALRARARDLGRRAGVDPEALQPSDVEHAGRVLALAYPDRLAIRRGGPGRFQLRTGQTAWLPATDELAGAAFVVAADLDGKRKDTRIRLAAALDATDVAGAFAHQVSERVELVWTDGELVERAERRLGGLVLDTVTRRPAAGPAVVDQLLARVRTTRLAALGWGASSVALRHRLAFLHRTLGEPWPDVSDEGLLGRLGEWLAPRLSDATSASALEAIDMTSVLWSMTDPRVAGDLDRLAPARLALPSGRTVPIDYTGDAPSASVRVQELFGVTTHPTAGGRPVVLQLLSPAGRPVQVTGDLPGFWAGSWREVRKEMAGRYPKHRWPEDPATADPGR